MKPSARGGRLKGYESVLSAAAAPRSLTAYGFKSTFNATLPDGGSPLGWVSPWHFAINQGPIVVMIENHQSGLVWQLMRSCPYIVAGLRAAGFTGAWLSDDARRA